MSRENPLWGGSRIHGELLMLGFEVAQSTVSKYMTRPPKPPSQTWKTFLRNHAEAIAAIAEHSRGTPNRGLPLGSLPWPGGVTRFCLLRIARRSG
jgi:hypothetical protein